MWIVQLAVLLLSVAINFRVTRFVFHLKGWFKYSKGFIMKQGHRSGVGGLLRVSLSMALALALVACGGGGGGSSGGSVSPGTTVPGATTTTISGKVKLSSTVAGKPGLKKAMYGAPKGKPGSKAYMAAKQSSSGLRAALLAPAQAAAFTSGTVYLYNSDHPEWLAPVSSSPTDSAGAYSMSKLENAAANGGAYKDGDPIPAGNYTLLAFKSGGFDPILGTTTTALVAVQTVVNKFEGTVAVSDLVAQESVALPTVTAMIGLKQNTDGTQTWGSAATNFPGNAAIQVNFSSAMSRGSLTNGIVISPAVSGKWSLSSDWTTATFYPDAGVTFTPNTVYTITVKGSDSGAAAAVKNVYGNALAKTAVGTFTATAVDTIAPTAIFVSPTTAQLANAVDVTLPIRIGSNKQLDVNGLTLDGKVAGVSSLGAKPGVLYVGYDTASSLYVYEFILGSPMQLGTTYDLTISGGKGLNGKAMNTLTGTIQTKSAAATTGVDAAASVATQSAQASVKSVFGNWVRAFNDRNITQLQSVMSGDFYFEDKNTDPQSDLNKDGRLSLAEFSDMLTKNAFPQWEFCGTVVTGDVVGNINVVGNNADFEFKLVGTSSKTSQACLNSLPTDAFYATVQNVNGAWTIVRASSGIDTRSKTITFPNLIDTLTLTQSQTGGVVTIADGGQAVLPYIPGATGPDAYPITWSWGATTGVSSYVLVRMDARDPQNGAACAFKSTVTSFISGSGCVASGGKDVSAKFGFNNNKGPAMMPANFLVDGGQYYWEVIGLGTVTTSTIAAKTSQELLKDITAISAMQSFNIAGTYKELVAQVYGGATATGTPLKFSTLFNGYDAGAANQVTLTVTTGNTTATTGYLQVSGYSNKSYPLTFASGIATVTVDLYQGDNWISVSDMSGLNANFGVTTTGGLQPVVKITSIKDQNLAVITGDAWKYYKATGATRITVAGTVDTITYPNITTVDVNVWNDTSAAYSYVSAPVTGGTFTATLDIYKGDNWVNVGSGFMDTATNTWVWNGDHAGVNTDTGTVWVPNISITSVTTATLSNDYGQSSDWDASLDADGVVTIAGKFKVPKNGTYNINSDGGYSNGTLVVLADGSFSLDVTLFKGWNYVSFQDSNYNWYGVNIDTTTAKAAVKPTVTTVNGVAPTVTLAGGSTVSVSGCSATVVGTAKAGSLNVNWNGFDGTTYNYESQNLTLTGAEPAAFSFNVPLVGGVGSYNNVDIWDASNGWTSVKVTTSSACTYAAPVIALTGVLDSAALAVAQDMSGNYLAGASSTVTITGTSSRAGRTINASAYACSSKSYSTTSSSVANLSGTYDWSISVPVYDGGNYIYVSDGWSSNVSVNVNTTNTLLATAPLTAAVSPGTVTYAGTCGYNNWDAGAATSVTITGTTTAPDGTGTYTDASGANQTFTITGGVYTIANVALYNGSNYISISDTKYNYQSVYISTTNGVPKPIYVDITAPTNTSGTAVTGVQTVTGTVSDPTASGYKPTIVNATVGVYDALTWTWTYTYYSSDATEQSMYGKQAMTYTASTGTFSISGVDFTGKYVYVDVSANDNVNYKYHNMTKYYNDGWNGLSTGYGYYNKSGAVKQPSVRSQAVAAGIMKQRSKAALGK